MKTLLIANPKGGSGKSTLATNLASYFAWQHERVMLGDLDRQHSARYWLHARPDNLPAIQGWDVDRDDIARPPRGTTVALLDSPAGLHGKRLESALKVASVVLVPVQPATFDMWAAGQFFARLAEAKAISKGRVRVGLIGMRFDPRTRLAAQLQAMLAEYDLPLIATLRNTQLYPQLAGRGMGLFDLPGSRFAQDMAQWQPLLSWLNDD